MSDTEIKTKSELLVHAYQMEIEAQDRYTYLADLMEVHNNPDLVKLFRKLSWVEGLHAKHILEQMGEEDDKDPQPHELKWEGGESPEAFDLAEADYLMSPNGALKLALEAEKNAYKFFADIVETTTDADMKTLAVEFAAEEKEHVELMQAELAKYPEADWPERDDMDEAMSQD